MTMIASDLEVEGGPAFPRARHMPFSGFNNKSAGATCCVVGRGPTRFDYEELTEVEDPIFFINDAIALEKYATSETFFFAHDEPMSVWLDGSIRATAVMPADGKILRGAAGRDLGHAGPVTFYRRGEKGRRELLGMSREEIAERGELFVHTGTMHSLLHFVWFCGFARVVFIGCDGINHLGVLARSSGTQTGYDTRLPNRSQTYPWWQYATIRKAQDLMVALFGMEAIYLGTPTN
jgi:hypothetical protein